MTQAPGKALAVTCFLALCLIWGTTWKVIQIGLEGIPPFSGVAIRFAIASVVLLAAALAAGVKLGATRTERLLWVANGICSFVVSYGIVYWAEQWVPSGLAAVLFATYPLFVTILAHFFLPAESLRGPEILGVVLGFAGVGIVFSEDFDALGGSQVAFAASVMLIAPVVSAVGSVSVKRWGAGVHPLSITAIPMAICAGVMGALALATERHRTFTWDAVSVGALLYLAVMGSAVTFSLYFWLLRHFPAKRISLIAYVIPIIAVALGVAMGEPLTNRALAGAAIVVAGVSVAVHSRRAQDALPAEADHVAPPGPEGTAPPAPPRTWEGR